MTATAALRTVERCPAAVALLPLALLAACTGAGRKGPGALTAESPWKAIRTPHFSVSTDLDREEAEQTALEFEAMFSTLSDVAFISGSAPTVNVDVVHFRRKQDYERFAPKRTAGYLLRGMGHDFEFRTRVVLQGDLVKATRAIMLHELTHFFVNHYYPQAQTWLNEGLAEYYSTLTQEGGATILGRLSMEVRFHRGPYTYDCPPDGCTALVPVSEARPITRLVAMTPAEYYGNLTSELDSAASETANRDTAINRASAASLVHFLFHDPRYRATFEDYLARLRSGTRGEAAWAATLGRLPAAALENDFRASLAPVGEVNVLKTEYAAPRRPPDEVRPLTPDEVQMLRARLWVWSTANNRAAARTELERVSAAGQATPEFALLNAGLLTADGQWPRARTLLEAALRSWPDDPRLLSSLGHVLLGLAETEKTPEAIDGALKPLAERLAPLSRTAAQDDLLARVRARQGAMAMAMAHEKRAVSRDPNCAHCLAFLAELFDRRGQPAVAAAHAELAQGLLHEGLRIPELDAQIQRYRAKLAGPGAPPAK
jgi:hypothetical protein